MLPATAGGDDAAGHVYASSHRPTRITALDHLLTQPAAALYVVFM